MPMRARDPFDQALEAATVALTNHSKNVSSRFASIELRSESREFGRLAPVGYLCSGLLGLSVVVTLWCI